MQTGRTPLDKLEQVRTTPRTALQRVQSTLHSGAEQAQTAATLLSTDALDAAAACLTNARHIAVLGSDVSAYLAGYFASYAGLFRPRVESLTLAGGASESQRKLMMLGPDDALLAISLPRYSRQTLELCALAHDRGIPVIAITQRPAFFASAEPGHR